jgi:hypothetical protein
MRAGALNVSTIKRPLRAISYRLICAGIFTAGKIEISAPVMRLPLVAQDEIDHRFRILA